MTREESKHINQILELANHSTDFNNIPLLDHLKFIIPSMQYVEYAPGSLAPGRFQVPKTWEFNYLEISDNDFYFKSKDAFSVWQNSMSLSEELRGDEILSKNYWPGGPEDGTPWNCFIPYREENWGVCLPPHISAKIRSKSYYKITIKASLMDAALKALVWPIKGQLPGTVVIHAHTCHPHQVNDNLSGIAAAYLIGLKAREDNQTPNLNIIFGPELFSALAAPGDNAIILVAVGNEGPLKVQLPRTRGALTLAIKSMVEETSLELHSWRRLYGNDEIIYEDADIPAATITRYPFPGYHTLDDSQVNVEQIVNAARVTLQILRRLEPIKVIHAEKMRKMWDKGLYLPVDHPCHHLMCNLPYLKGMTLLEIVNKYNLPYWETYKYLKDCEAEDLCRLS